MSTEKFLGVWMDHTNAHLLQFSEGNMETQTIVSDLTHEAKSQIRTREENHHYDNGKAQKKDYYGRISDVMKNYKEVLLFGPTDAKAELFRHIKGDTDMIRVNVVIKHAEKLKPADEENFAREYFSKFSSRIFQKSEDVK